MKFGKVATAFRNFVAKPWTSDVAQAIHAAVHQRRSLRDILATPSASLRLKPQVPDEPPLAFVHIPKTAGGSVEVFLKDRFDFEEIFPAGNQTAEFTANRLAQFPRAKLFTGHFGITALNALPRNTLTFTLLRSTFDIYHSMYYHVRDQDMEYFKREVHDYYQRLLDSGYIARIPEEERDRWIAEQDRQVRYARETPIEDIGKTQDPMFGNIFFNFVTSYFISEDGEIFARPRKQEEALHNLRQIDLVGTTEKLQLALRALCAQRGWPAPRDLPRIHDRGASTRRRTVAQGTIDRVIADQKSDHALYKAALEREAELYERLPAAPDAQEQIDAWLDERHCERVFANARPQEIVEFDIADKWPGTNWGARFPAEAPTGRPLPVKEHATLFARLASAEDYAAIVRSANTAGNSEFTARIDMDSQDLSNARFDTERDQIVTARLPAQLIEKAGQDVQLSIRNARPWGTAPDIYQVWLIPARLVPSTIKLPARS